MKPVKTLFATAVLSVGVTAAGYGMELANDIAKKDALLSCLYQDPAAIDQCTRITELIYANQTPGLLEGIGLVGVMGSGTMIGWVVYRQVVGGQPSPA